MVQVQNPRGQRPRLQGSSRFSVAGLVEPGQENRGHRPRLQNLSNVSVAGPVGAGRKNRGHRPRLQVLPHRAVAGRGEAGQEIFAPSQHPTYAKQPKRGQQRKRRARAGINGRFFAAENGLRELDAPKIVKRCPVAMNQPQNTLERLRAADRRANPRGKRRSPKINPFYPPPKQIGQMRKKQIVEALGNFLPAANVGQVALPPPVLRDRTATLDADGRACKTRQEAPPPRPCSL